MGWRRRLVAIVVKGMKPRPPRFRFNQSTRVQDHHGTRSLPQPTSLRAVGGIRSAREPRVKMCVRCELDAEAVTCAWRPSRWVKTRRPRRCAFALHAPTCVGLESGQHVTAERIYVQSKAKRRKHGTASRRALHVFCVYVHTAMAHAARMSDMVM
jgi:hypothetical protein